MATLSYLLHWFLTSILPVSPPTKEVRSTPPHKKPPTELSGHNTKHEEVWDYVKIDGTMFRVRYVNEPATPRPSPMRGKSGGRSGYVIDRERPYGWEKQYDDMIYGGLSSVKDELENRIPRLMREENCSHPDRTKTRIGIGGEMVPAEKCTECGHLDYW